MRSADSWNECRRSFFKCRYAYPSPGSRYGLTLSATLFVFPGLFLTRRGIQWRTPGREPLEWRTVWVIAILDIRCWMMNYVDCPIVNNLSAQHRCGISALFMGFRFGLLTAVVFGIWRLNCRRRRIKRMPPGRKPFERRTIWVIAIFDVRCWMMNNGNCNITDNLSAHCRHDPLAPNSFADCQSRSAPFAKHGILP